MTNEEERGVAGWAMVQFMPASHREGHLFPRVAGSRTVITWLCWFVETAHLDAGWGAN
jgi:hypothetical protein